MSDYLHPDLRLLAALAEVLEVSARELSKRAQQHYHARTRKKRGGTLRPGYDTPLWQALAAAVRPHLAKRGTRALLARELGVHVSRITEYFVKGTAMPDAERALILMLWLARRRDTKPSPATRPTQSP